MRFFIVFLLTYSAFAQTSVVDNAADESLQGVAAPGSLVIIPGVGSFSNPSATVRPFSGQAEPAAVILAGRVGSGGFLSTFEILLPQDLPLGPAELAWFDNGTPVGSANFIVVASSFRVFTRDFSTEGASLTNPGRAGRTITIFGTGLGRATSDQIRVLLGGHPAPLIGAGPATGQPGVDQVSFQIPDDPKIPDGCFVAVEVRVAGAFGNVTTIPKSSQAGVCSTPWNLTADELNRAQSGNLGGFEFQINGSANWQPADGIIPAGLIRNESFAPLPLPSLAAVIGPAVADDAFDECRPAPVDVSSAVLISIPIPSALSGFGEVLTLSGPDAVARISPPYTTSLPTGPPVDSPSQLPPPIFVPGQWSVSSSGSSTTGAFQSSIELPAVIHASNYADLQAIDRSKDVIVTWDPSGYSGDDAVSVTIGAPGYGIWYVASTVFSGSIVTGQAAACRAIATRGRIVIPAAMLKDLPENLFLQISASRRPDRLTGFRIPAMGGASVPALMRYSFTESFPVEVRP